MNQSTVRQGIQLDHTWQPVHNGVGCGGGLGGVTLLESVMALLVSLMEQTEEKNDTCWTHWLPDLLNNLTQHPFSTHDASSSSSNQLSVAADFLSWQECKPRRTYASRLECMCQEVLLRSHRRNPEKNEPLVDFAMNVLNNLLSRDGRATNLSQLDAGVFLVVVSRRQWSSRTSQLMFEFLRTHQMCCTNNDGYGDLASRMLLEAPLSHLTWWIASEFLEDALHSDWLQPLSFSERNIVEHLKAQSRQQHHPFSNSLLQVKATIRVSYAQMVLQRWQNEVFPRFLEEMKIQHGIAEDLARFVITPFLTPEPGYPFDAETPRETRERERKTKLEQSGCTIC